MIPNSTQIPNNLFNGEMAKMKDTELRITLLVARKTLGWVEDTETGMRKTEDWISHTQLIKFTGKTGRAISTAIESCMIKKWIEARNKKGELLNTPQDRVGQKIFYRLGKIFLDKAEQVITSEKSSQVAQTSEKSSIEKSSIEKSSAYKRNYITKETDKQNNVSKADEEYSFIKKLSDMKKDKRRHINIIAFYWQVKKIKPENEKQYQALLRRELKPARDLMGFTNEQIKNTSAWLQKQDFKFTLETVIKYISEDLEALDAKSSQIIKI